MREIIERLSPLVGFTVSDLESRDRINENLKYDGSSGARLVEL